MSGPALRRMSVEEYLRTEPDSPVKREYVNGFVYAVENGGVRARAGSSRAHADITVNILFKVRPLARSQGCRAYASEIKLKVEGRNSYYYSDVLVACGPETGDPYSETSPCLLVEVLSRGTAHTDHNAKYQAYTSLPSLQTYLLVEQTERRVYAYSRQGEGWELTEYVGQGEVSLPCPGLTLTLDDISDGVL